MAIETDDKIFEGLSAVYSIKWNELTNSGYVVETLIAGFWGVIYYDTFENSLVKIVNRRNNADTCGAVTGALCGAYYGQDAMPMRWPKRLEMAKKSECCGLHCSILDLLHELHI